MPKLLRTYASSDPSKHKSPHTEVCIATLTRRHEVWGPATAQTKSNPAPVLPESKGKSAAHGRRRARSSTRR